MGMKRGYLFPGVAEDWVNEGDAQLLFSLF